MNAIPPGWLGSIIQGSSAQQRSAANKAAENAAAGERAAFADRLADVIDQTERDSQVFSDAEGSGGQGRSEEQGTREPAPDKPDLDQASTTGLDLEA